MSSVFRFLFAVFFQVSATASCMAQSPPSIVRHPLPLRIFRSDEQIDLDCEAKGQPTLRYRWFKDGVAIEESNRPNVQFLTENSIRILSASVIDEGLYTCQASNDLGTAVSSDARLQKAELATFLRPPDLSPQEPRLYSVVEYSALRMSCNAPVSLPSATFSWVLARGTVDDNPIRVSLSKRIQVDPTGGDLFFSYATASDANGVYKCEVFNPFLDLRASGSYSKANITQRSTEETPLPLPPSILFSTDEVVALEHAIAVLRCFFAGFPEVTIRWHRLDRRPLPFNRFAIENFASELRILNVDQTDEADYVCIGRNDLGEEEERVLHLSVQAAPRFLSLFDRPFDLNATDGDQELTINCRPYAEPTANVTWYQNAIPIDFSATETNIRLGSHASASSIVISRLCKNCSKTFGGGGGGGLGSTVIQCKASNIHGSVTVNGYINVLDRTRIIVAPKDASFEMGENATFLCQAVSDRSTSLSYEWYHNGSLISSSEDPSSEDPSSATLHITTVNDRDRGMSRVWTYLCRVSNGYSVAEARANLVLFLEDIEQTSVSMSFFGWLSLLILLLAFLLLLICFIACCYKYRLSENYNVDEKEKKRGIYPETELADLDFKVYIRPEGLLSKSLVSLDIQSQCTTLSKNYGTDGKSDEGSWNFERWFNEDGSFIGLYKEKQ